MAGDDVDVERARSAVLAERGLTEADRLDAEGLPESAPLAGVPVAIKDDTDVVGEVTAWGTGVPVAPKVHDARSWPGCGAPGRS